MPKLSARYVETLKPIAGKRLELADHVVKGLSLRVSTVGVKSWALRYRNRSGVQRRLTLGGFPALSLERARNAARKALGQVADERDPAGEKQKELRLARRAVHENPQTLGDLWTVYARVELPKRRASSVKYLTWLWTRRIAPRLGGQSLADIDKTVVRDEMREIGETAPVTANRAQALVRRMFNFAAEEGIIATSPLVRMRKLYEETSRDRVLSDAELKTFWRALEETPSRRDIPVSARMCAALKLVLLTGARPGDVAGLHATEIDIAARSWTIPAGRYKTKRAQTVPLSELAWRAIEGLFDGSPEVWSGYAFQHARDHSRSMCVKSMTRAMERIRKCISMERATPHDLRRTTATFLASERIGAAPHIVSEVLGHAAQGPASTVIYARYRYDAEKRVALSAWANLLLGIVDDRPSVEAITTCLEGPANGLAVVR